MAVDTPLLVLGGGCSGLSLAIELSRLSPNAPQAIILESRQRYENDRTWCFWADAAIPVSHLIAHQWSRLTVRDSGGEAEMDCSLYPYQILPSGAFYAHATAILATTPTIKLLQGMHVRGEPTLRNGFWHVETDNEIFRAKRVVDTRPMAPTSGGATLWQSFLGAEVLCDKAQFDSSRAMLMDFAKNTPERVQFSYVLPTSATCALIELTVFDPKPQSLEDLSDLLEKAILTQVNGSPYQILRREHGILPMGLRQTPQHKNQSLVRAGIAGGAARMSSGYAFQRIQRWARICASELVRGGLPQGHPTDPPLRAAMDHLFLAVLRDHPGRAPQIFTQLFKRTAGARIARFLSDRSGIFDNLAIISALPPRLFLSYVPQAIQYLIRRPCRAFAE